MVPGSIVRRLIARKYAEPLSSRDGSDTCAS
jgi:hypothetical protein